MHPIGFGIDWIGLTNNILQKHACLSSNRELKQIDEAAVNKQISIQNDSRPSEFSRPLT